jgi:hypothetical protein
LRRIEAAASRLDSGASPAQPKLAPKRGAPSIH